MTSIRVKQCVSGLVAAFLWVGCARHEVRVVRGEATTTDGEYSMAVSSARFEGVYLKARILLNSTNGALRLGPRATYCESLFHLVDLKTCSGEPLHVIHGDCVGPSEGTEDPITVEQGVWIGQDNTWYIGEELPACVEVHLQTFFYGAGGRRPGPRLAFRAYQTEEVELVPPREKYDPP